MKSSLYLALVHHPVYDRQGAIVTTSITNMDVHDIARTGRTFGVRRFYVVHPVPGLRSLAERIVEHVDEPLGRRGQAQRAAPLVARHDGALQDVGAAQQRGHLGDPPLRDEAPHAGGARGLAVGRADQLGDLHGEPPAAAVGAHALRGAHPAVPEPEVRALPGKRRIP